jgi:glycosyltransferase involved in cell wall biosynthesis
MNQAGASVRSVMPSGNGAYIVHAELSQTLAGYKLEACNPYLASIPGLPSRLLRQWLGGAEVVHLSPNTGHIPLPSGKRRVLTFHSFDIDPADMEQASVAQRIYYRHVLRPAIIAACASAERIVAVSRYVADCIRHHGLAGKKSLEVIYNGIDTERFRPATPRADDRPLRILFVGNPSRRKGFHLLTALAEKLPPGVELAFTTGLRNQQVQSVHPRLVSLGSIPYSKMHLAYQQADILLFPAYREGFGLCVAEAMSCGLPVISTRCSAIPELVTEGFGGFLVPPGDFPAMLEKILLLLQQTSLRESMGAWNRTRAIEYFDRKRMANEYQAIFAN